ncbi:hypothetical protein C8R45DRAFT_939008 [Mycena sanguinolenta]|nr:hypothetical protein C8R45DRAFT_939008 [Mycena sanguinolenta]
MPEIAVLHQKTPLVRDCLVLGLPPISWATIFAVTVRGLPRDTDLKRRGNMAALEFCEKMIGIAGPLEVDPTKLPEGAMDAYKLGWLSMDEVRTPEQTITIMDFPSLLHRCRLSSLLYGSDQPNTRVQAMTLEEFAFAPPHHMASSPPILTGPPRTVEIYYEVNICIGVDVGLEKMDLDTGCASATGATRWLPDRAQKWQASGSNEPLAATHVIFWRWSHPLAHVISATGWLQWLPKQSEPTDEIQAFGFKHQYCDLALPLRVHLTPFGDIEVRTARISSTEIRTLSHARDVSGHLWPRDAGCTRPPCNLRKASQHAARCATASQHRVHLGWGLRSGRELASVSHAVHRAWCSHAVACAVLPCLGFVVCKAGNELDGRVVCASKSIHADFSSSLLQVLWRIRAPTACARTELNKRWRGDETGTWPIPRAAVVRKRITPSAVVLSPERLRAIRIAHARVASSARATHSGTRSASKNQMYY